LSVGGDPGDAVTAWHGQRSRLRGWLDALPDDDWDGPTRCAGWDTTLLVRHLASATQFLAYTLREASQGTATTLLEGMDTRTTVASAAELLGQLTPAGARSLLAEQDLAVDEALEALGAPHGSGLLATAECPAGHVPAHVAVRHFLFDSWVHEYDLLVPCGAQPVVDPLEAQVVVGYLIGLAEIATGAGAEPIALDLRITDPGMRIGVHGADGVVVVTPGRAPVGAAVLEGRAPDVVDRMTGRRGGPVSGDDAALAVLDRFALVLST
jgi:uncharacterized protein (TIGR03083 family)